MTDGGDELRRGSRIPERGRPNPSNRNRSCRHGPSGHVARVVFVIRMTPDKQKETGLKLKDTRRPLHSPVAAALVHLASSPGILSVHVSCRDGGREGEPVRFNFEAIKAPNIVDLSKKRKILSEHFDLPLPKHKCLDGGFDPVLLFGYDGNPDIEDLPASKIKRPIEGCCSCNELQPESAKDSNCFAEDSDIAMSAYGGCNLGPDVAVITSGASTSSVKWAWNSSQDMPHSSGAEKAVTRVDNNDGVGKHDPPDQDNDFQMLLEEQLLEFGCHGGYTCEYANDCLETCATKEVEDSIYSNASNPDNFVLSSGRWSTNHDTLLGTRKPTIDQEFEDYFSTLMM
ncbi:protein FAR-RED-ELONGATED HYPOCOTYL 1-LIKE isoform X2 [Rhodamnia argentea]|uniref:Protein FAR-RED-ELONGATED HYPOCOTYL 1-LIKE isoform X2 n=1 Tax=Rhodamnia argentea TaxID=178133 RepID=A0ABM3HNP2_9MYRT|nr:protein FAR-RED-ELONGATED HYPOCOTYL 1-LIKE isoform X2 [Rhodamnia argentea]